MVTFRHYKEEEEGNEMSNFISNDFKTDKPHVGNDVRCGGVFSKDLGIGGSVVGVELGISFLNWDKVRSWQSSRGGRWRCSVKQLSKCCLCVVSRVCFTGPRTPSVYLKG